eukprot:9167475-Alexandrium_andersonii.AAC.1
MGRRRPLLALPPFAAARTRSSASCSPSAGSCRTSASPCSPCWPCRPSPLPRTCSPLAGVRARLAGRRATAVGVGCFRLTCGAGCA